MLAVSMVEVKAHRVVLVKGVRLTEPLGLSRTYKD